MCIIITIIFNPSSDLKRSLCPTFQKEFNKFRKINFHTKTICNINFKVPFSFHEAVTCKNRSRWKNAIAEKLDIWIYYSYGK